MARSTSRRFVARVFLELDKVEGGFGNGLGGSARRIDSGRKVGRDVSGENGGLGFTSS